ncbi:MFS transporter [bacterium]|nr:MAG: MFS transporter [bacterium]
MQLTARDRVHGTAEENGDRQGALVGAAGYLEVPSRMTDIGTRPKTGPPAGYGLLFAVLGPFACGYFLSYLLRNVNALISPDLVRTFQLDASDLGLLTSAYFLTFALFQPLLGVLLDRFGPRRVEGSLLLVAAAGSLLFAWSNNTFLLITGRGLIGLGVSACLMAGFQANALWFSQQRLAGLNGWVLAAGGIGAVFSTAPVEWALEWIDWRMLFTVFAGAFAATSALIFALVPERREPQAYATIVDQFKGFWIIGKNREFWRIAPIGMFSQSTFMALQGLWAASWMKDVGGQGRDEVAHYLLLAAIGMVAGHMTMGNLASRLERAGIAPSYVVGIGVGVGILVHASLAVGYLGMQSIIWFLFGFLGTAGTVNYAILPQAFPVSMAGRVITALNLLVFVASFLVQWGIGIVINFYPTGGGSYAPEGYTVAFGASVILQVAALFWFFRGITELPGKSLSEKD